MCYKVFLVLTASKSAWEPLLFWGAGPSRCEGDRFLLNLSVYSKKNVASGRQSVSALRREGRTFGIWTLEVGSEDAGEDGCRIRSSICWKKGSLRFGMRTLGSPNAKPNWAKSRRESRISWTTVCQVLCFGHRDGMEVRAGETYEQGEDSGAQGGQANPRLRSPPPAPPQTRSPVAWSTPRRSSPGTGWGAASWLRCGWSGLRPGRSETQRHVL